MRRPVSVNTVFSFSYQRFFGLSRAASVAILPSALFVERFPLGASWASSIQQVLLPEERAYRHVGTKRKSDDDEATYQGLAHNQR